ncbi:MAG TPA: hypothetical protein DEB06_04895 [Phycisphaerales bacterium]|nr:hypothetical protein [Phycisphaerales bacterium]
MLGVSRSASADDIRAAYRKLARQYHPDVNKSPEAGARFNEVQEAYDTLSDAEKRKHYDRWGHAGPSPFGPGGPPGSAGARRGGGGGPGGTYTWTNVAGQPASGEFGDFDVGSMFEEIFGGPAGAGRAGGPFGAQARARSKPAKGRDIAQELPVEFMTAALGGTHTLRVRRGGTTQTIEVSIPRGASDGTRLRVAGAGSPSAGGAAPGDLILSVRIEPHPYFSRDGLDVEVEVPVSIVEASLGATVEVPTLRGRATVTIPEGSASGRRLRLRGQGITDASGATGDLYAVVKVVPPAKPDEAQRRALEALRGALPPVRTGPPWSD